MRFKIVLFTIFVLALGGIVNAALRVHLHLLQSQHQTLLEVGLAPQHRTPSYQWTQVIRLSALHISLLGEATIRIDGETITDVATRKAEALLVYLACNRRPHRREVLSELLWDDLRPERALGNLRLVLNQLRPRFDRFLSITRYTVALHADAPLWLDVDVLAQGLAGDEVAAAKALALYRGDFLQGFHLRDARGFSEWQSIQAEHWRRMALDGMRRLITHYSAWSNYAEALTWTRHLLSLDPLDEEAHRQMMLLLMRSGRRHAALHHYHDVVALLATELGADPESATTTLYQRIQAGPEQRPYNVPRQSGPLIGRDAEFGRIWAWLATTSSRLLTISGAGGSGKTRLALSVAQRIATELLGPFDDGVFYLALTSNRQDLLVDEVALLLAIAHTFELQLVPRQPLAGQVGSFLRSRELLLIIDNGELLDRHARLVLSELLQQAPTLRLLVPSRERLKLRDEYVLELDGLRYPTHVLAMEPVQATDFAAVQLLLFHAERTGGAAAGSAYSYAHQEALAAICRLVHGLPLAIELAAPWLALRTPVELLTAIRETLDVLQHDAPDLPERHRSIRAVFEYSWCLLTAPEAQVLANLSVFPTDFGADAALAVADASLAILGTLRDKSLVQAYPGEPETRYALHPLLQRFAQEKLETDPPAAARVRARHAQYFALFAQERKPLLYGPHSSTAIADIAREFANMRAGWDWAAAAHDISMLGVYSIPLHDFCALHGWKVESHDMFGIAAAAIRAWNERADFDETTALAAVRVLSCYAELQQIMGDLATAEQIYHDCRVLLNAVAAEDTPELLFVYKQIGLLAYGRGAYAEAMQYLRLTLAIAEEGNERVREADTLLAIGAVAIAEGAWATAEQTLQRGLALYDDLQYDWGRAHALRFLGTLALIADDRAAAATYLDTSLELSRQIGNRIGTALVLDQLGLLYLGAQQFDQSAAALNEAYELFHESGVDLGVGRTLVHLSRLSLIQGQSEAARRRLAHALQIAERLPSPPLMLECAAVILALQQSTGSAMFPAADVLAEALSRHPACSAEARQQFAAFIDNHVPSDQVVSVPALEELLPTLQAFLADGGIARAIAN